MDKERVSRAKHMLSSRSGDKRSNAPLMQSANKQRKKQWMQSAVKHPGALTRKAAAAGQSVSSFANSHDTGNSQTAKQSRLAEVFAKFRK